MNKNGLTILWAVLFLAGCITLPMPTPPVIVPTGTAQATARPAMPRLLEPTSGAPAVSRFSQNCLKIEDGAVNLDGMASETFLFYVTPPDEQLILKDAQTGDEHILSAKTQSTTFPYFQIAPNRKMIALIEWELSDKAVTIRNILWVFDARGRVLSKVTFDRTDLGALRWLDDQRLLIDTGKYGNLLMVDPFTREQQVIADDLPNLYPYYQTGLWWPVVYSPDLNWVTYYSARTENGHYREGPLVYNLTTKKILWEAGNEVGSNAAWSPDGQELAFTGGMDERQLFLFSQSGQIKEVLDKSLQHEALAFSWSPNGHLIAFWNAERLMIYDRQMDWVFDTCIPGEVTADPDWSPDSREIIVNAYSAQPIVVDWQNKIAHKIKVTPNQVIYGWMNSLP